MKWIRWALLIVAGAVAVYLLLPYRLFYKDGRPTRAGRALNDFQAWAFGTGLLPPLLVSLEVRGWRSGEVHRTSLVAGEYEGERYLVCRPGGGRPEARLMPSAVTLARCGSRSSGTSNM